MPTLKLAIDRQNRKLVNYGGTASAIPPIFQQNQQPLEITIVDPPATPTGAYSAVDANAYGLRVSICSTPTGTTTDDTRLTFEDDFTWDAANRKFTGTLATNVAAVATYIGAGDQRVAYFEVNLMAGSDPTTVLQTTFLLKAIGDNFATTAPTPTDEYYTKVQANDKFAAKTMANGEHLIIPSPSGTYALELGCADDGSAIMNVITL